MKVDDLGLDYKDMNCWVIDLPGATLDDLLGISRHEK